MNDLRFLVPEWWPALLLVIAAVWGGSALGKAAAARRAARFHGREDAVCGRGAFVRARAACAVAAAVCATTAMLRPVWGPGDGAPVGPQVVLCLDVSRSMDARDAAPTRLAAAQRAVEVFALGGPGARLGLVLHAGAARLAAPLSDDLPSVAAIARTAFAGAVERGGSDLGAAIDAGAAALQRGRAAAGAIVVLSDGEDFVGAGVDAARRSRTAGFVVHCLGFGSDAGSKIVVAADGGESYLRDTNGADVVTRLEREHLAAVAAAGGGRFVAPAADGDVVRLIEETLVPAARAAAVHDESRTPAHRFQWPLLAALLLWMLRVALPERTPLLHRRR
ncbi:MAG: VWA domain-containing protein [Planctomycetes bacterium]|nr:VWA domain-containing protein [Planctomycetota bacterium]